LHYRQRPTREPKQVENKDNAANDRARTPHADVLSVQTDPVIRVYDAAGNVIETHEDGGNIPDAGIFLALCTLTMMKTRSAIWLIGFAALLLSIASLSAGEVSFESKPTKTRLLELYTSEGCSSCPPAERWLSGLTDSPRLWRDFAPLAFHVDYWDRLGWRDPYATKQWTERQYQYSALWNTSSVYTPGFVLDGNEWQNNSLPPPSSDTPGILIVTLRNETTVDAHFASIKGEVNPLELHVAQLGFGLISHVKAGENSGRKLEHDFVVLSLSSGKLIDGASSLRLPQTSASVLGNGRAALVAWITKPGAMEPIQTVGGWLR
jgi:hypothetical protein